MYMLESIPSTIKHSITLVVGILLLLDALDIFSTHIRIVIIAIALMLIISSFISLGGLNKITQLFCNKKTDTKVEKKDDRDNDLF